jgi:hypothetical protein
MLMLKDNYIIYKYLFMGEIDIENSEFKIIE